MQKGPGFYQQHQGNRMVYSKHVQQLPNLSSQNSLMQAPMQTRPTFVSTSETHIRPIVENRMPIYSQGQPSEVTPGYTNHPYHVQGQYQNIQQFTPPYGNNYMPRNPQYPSVYVVPQGVAPQGGNYTNNPVVIAPTINPASQSHQIANQPQPQSQHLYPQMSSSQPPPIIQQQPQNDASFQKKRTAIKLTDPNTGKDLTNEVFTKKPVIKPPPVANSEENIKAKTAALFAAQVAKKIAASEAEEGPQIETKVDISEAAENETTKELTLPKETTSTEQNDLSVGDSQNVNDTNVSKNENGVTEIKITKTVNLVGCDKPADDVIEKILETKVPLENSPDTSQIILSDDLVLPPSEVDTASVTNALAVPEEVPLISSTCETDAPKGEPVSQLSEGDGFVDRNIHDDVQEVPPVIESIDPVQELADNEKEGPGKPSESQNTQPIPKGTEIPRIKEVPVNPTVESVVEGAVEENVEKKEETSVTKTVNQTSSDVEIKTKGVSLPDPNAAETNENIQFMSEESEECKFKTESDSILPSSKIEPNVTDQDKKEITVDQASDKVNVIPESKSVPEEACDDVSVVEFTNVTDSTSTVAEKESLLTKNKDSAFKEEPAKNEKNKKNQKNKKKDKKAATAACSKQVEAQNKGNTSKDVPCKEVPLEKDVDTQKEEKDNTDKSDEDSVEKETENPIKGINKTALIEMKEEDSKSDKDLDIMQKEVNPNLSNMEEKKTENTGGAPTVEEERATKEKETQKKEVLSTNPQETEKSEAVGCQKINNGTKDSEESSNKPSKKPMEKEESGKPTADPKARSKEAASRRFEPSFSFKPKEPVKPVSKTVDSVKKDVTTEKESSNIGVVNGHDEVVKSATIINPVTKKKKGKNRFKDIELKESNDLLSAFVDAPKEIKEQPKEPVLIAEKPPEEATWEDKEIEDIHGEDEDNSQAAKKVQTKISKVESTEERHQYDRDFLLKFQFSPICTSKPVGLPDIDIILDQAHAPTKAVVPGTSISTGNNFMPTFMRQASGGRNTSSGGGGGGFGGGRGSGGGGGGGGGGGRNSREKDRGSQNTPSRQQQKVISIPQFEKVELKKSENAWVRPSEKLKNMSAEDRELYEVDRAVCSILNKLTPQKFKPLVQQMTDLKLSNGTKLEKAISLIFEKAVSEPGFSVAYANMCRVLTEAFNKVPANNEPNAPVVTFRKILLNKCQTEFERESKDEKELEEQRNRTFDTEEERKFNLEEIAYKERANRRRTLGNIRFIGELYKLKMISEPIMHDCIYKLLKAEKQDSLEDQLECLCKLLATIGKILDHAKAKPIMDQYFDQMYKIMEKRKISSRIKFAMRDVIDLRKNQWVPRRDEGAPKTIDQIHREAQEKEKEEEKARQQEKIAKKLEPKGGRGGGGGGGGRDSPSMRPGGGKAPTSDGWNTVPNKSTRQSMPAPVDVSKLRFRKADTSENISLGPGGRPGAWSKGASGGGSSRSSSGTKPPNVERDQRMNRFDALSDNSNSFERNFDRSGGSRKGSQEGVRNRNDRPDRDRHDAFRSVRDVSGPGSRNQSPGPGSRSQSPALVRSRNQSPAPPRTPDEQSRGRVTAPEPVTEDKMRKVTKSTIEEFLSVKDEKEVMLCIKELRSPSMHHIFVEESMTIALEKKPDDRRGVGMIFNRMIKDGVIDVNQVCRGLATIVQFAPDFAVDIPHIYKYVGEIIGPIIVNGILPLGKVRDTIKPLIQIGKAGIVMAVVLSVAVQITNREDIIAELWINENMSWDELLQNNVEEFLKDHKLEFTVKSPSPAPSSSHGNQMQEELLQILRQSNSDKNDQAISYIESHMKSAELKTPEFIRLLTTVVCTSTISKDSENNCTCKRDLLKKRKTILLRYIDRSKDLELQSLFAIQQLVEDLKHPRGVLHAIFDELYQGDIVSEETFFLWESSKESPVGKGPALSSVKDFLSWLRKADEESNDDEESSTLTNT